jgi:hypothetical protein
MSVMLTRLLIIMGSTTGDTICESTSISISIEDNFSSLPVFGLQVFEGTSPPAQSASLF